MVFTQSLNIEKQQLARVSHLISFCFILISALNISVSWAQSPTGEILLGYRHFWESRDGLPSNQTGIDVVPRFDFDVLQDTTLILEPALRARNHDNQSVFVDPFKSRFNTYVDQVEITAGYDIVFWGASEGAQILNILNQKDLGTDFSGDQSLGQSMVNISGYVGEGLATFYYLPYTPKRRFREYSERLSAGFDIDGENVQWRDSQHAYYPGFAARYAYSFNDMDIALLGFHGINREPAFVVEAGEFAPIYTVGTQIGMEVQRVMGNLLTKFEVLNVSDAPTLRGDFDETTQYVIAGEYSVFSVFDSGADLKWVAEYSDNTLGEDLLSLYQHDVLLAVHTSLNDVDSTEISLSVLHDLDHGSNIIEITLTRRLTQNIDLAATFFDLSAMSANDFFYGLEPDSYGEITLTYYF
ncbi:hypothetical protein A1OQ_20605 [Enterovibrio norvegicus FF-162]|uniref:hypothetical protein n=1 Tax=Enterovibrio norvegicus TaxID=188144 RepID=UPI000308AF42|nr:hypothetical protein [Enterovibrio norvegicus]OEE81757.1 hypothetical protein A1OQ_20605 [Enterovibrio norvegicus FF-162]